MPDVEAEEVSHDPRLPCVDDPQRIHTIVAEIHKYTYTHYTLYTIHYTHYTCVELHKYTTKTVAPQVQVVLVEVHTPRHQYDAVQYTEYSAVMQQSVLEKFSCQCYSCHSVLVLQNSFKYLPC